MSGDHTQVQWVHNDHTGERIVFRGGPEQLGEDAMRFDFYAAPSGGVPFEHYHGRQSETFRMLRGELEVVMDGETRTIREGQELTLPPGCRHSLINRTDEEIHCEVEYRPAGINEWWFKTVHPFQHQVRREPTMLELAPLLARGVEVWPANIPRWAGVPVIAFMGLVGKLLGTPAAVERHVQQYYATRPSLEQVTPPESRPQSAVGE